MPTKKKTPTTAKPKAETKPKPTKSQEKRVAVQSKPVEVEANIIPGDATELYRNGEVIGFTTSKELTSDECSIAEVHLAGAQGTPNGPVYTYKYND